MINNMAPTLMSPAYYIPQHVFAPMGGVMYGLPLHQAPLAAQSSPGSMAASPSPDHGLLDYSSPGPYVQYVDACPASVATVPHMEAAHPIPSMMSRPAPAFYPSELAESPMSRPAPAFYPSELVSPPVSVPVSMPAVVGSAVASSPQPAAVPAGSPVTMTQMPSQAVYPMSVTTQMEFVWHGEFERLFANLSPDNWTLSPITDPPTDPGFHIFKDSAKVRFTCQECGRGWTSMKGRVSFWYRRDQPNTGEVYFKLYGQTCQKCLDAERFEHAMWYPEEVIKVIGNMYNQAGQKFYNFHRPPIRVDRRSGKPRSQHDSKLCQACRDGICREEWSFC